MKKKKFNSSLKKNILSMNSSVLEAIRKIKTLKKKILLITNNKKLIGTITDGDLRKSFFLKSNQIKVSDIVNKKPKVIRAGLKNFNNEDMFKINYVPIIDNKNNLIDLKNISTVKKIKFKNHIIIFAGGAGKRLYPYTKKIPKPMLKIKNKPNLETLIKNIRKFGFENKEFTREVSGINERVETNVKISGTIHLIGIGLSF